MERDGKFESQSNHSHSHLELLHSPPDRFMCFEAAFLNTHLLNLCVSEEVFSCVIEDTKIIEGGGHC